MLEDILWDIRYFIEDHKKGCIIFGSVFLVLTVLVVGIRSYNKKRHVNEPVSQNTTSTTDTTSTVVEEIPQYVNEEYKRLLEKQDSFKAAYGELPEGFLWDTGRVIYSQGDKSMTIEETVFAYLSGIQTLDMLTVQRYSFASNIVATYQNYFTDKTSSGGLSNNFLRDVYKEALMSLQASQIATSSTFAENKAVVTVNAKMLDLSDKEFWVKDKLSIFKNLYLYSLTDDNAKYLNFLYSYIIGYYRSGTAKLRDVQFTLTLQKYPQYDSGWLVSIDKDLNSLCTYKEGSLISKYILKEYREEGRDTIKAMKDEGTLETVPTYVFGISGEDINDSSTSYYTDFSSQGGSGNTVENNSSGYSGTMGSDVVVNGDGTVTDNSSYSEEQDYVYVPNPYSNSTNPMDYMQPVGGSGNLGLDMGGDSGLEITTTDDF